MSNQRKDERPKAPRGSKRWVEEQRNKIEEDLHRLDLECQNMLARIGDITPYLRNADLVNAGRKSDISTQATILARDIKQIKEELNLIRAARPKQINPDDPDDLTAILDIGQRYESWQNRFMDVIMPTIAQLNDLLVEAGSNLSENQQANNREQ